MPNIQDQITEIVKQFTIIAGADAMFILNLSDASVQVVYPEKDSESTEFMATTTAISIVRFESGIKSMSGTFSIEQMELSSQDEKVFTLRISDDYILCIIGSADLKVGFVRSMFDRTFKDKIVSVMKEAGII